MDVSTQNLQQVIFSLKKIPHHFYLSTSINEYYKFHEKIGVGQYATVYKAVKYSNFFTTSLSP